DAVPAPVVEQFGYGRFDRIGRADIDVEPYRAGEHPVEEDVFVVLGVRHVRHVAFSFEPLRGPLRRRGIVRLQPGVGARPPAVPIVRVVGGRPAGDRTATEGARRFARSVASAIAPGLGASEVRRAGGAFGPTFSPAQATPSRLRDTTE